MTAALAENRGLSADRYCLTEETGGGGDEGGAECAGRRLLQALTCPLTHSFPCLATSHLRKIFFCGFKEFALRSARYSRDRRPANRERADFMSHYLPELA